MRILYLAHRIPYPPNKGDKIRSFHEIRFLSRRHEIHLFAFCDQPDDLGHANKLKEYCQSVTLVPLNLWIQRARAGMAVLSGLPWSLGYFRNPLMGKALSKELRAHSFDLILVYSSSMAPYAQSIPGVRKILDFVDSDAGKWEQYADFKSYPAKYLYSYESRVLARFEAAMINEFDCSVFVSPREAKHLARPIDKKFHFIQNGIDLDFYSISNRDTAARNIVFVGAMDYFPNIDAVKFFAHKVYPIVRLSCPEARFLIVGSRPVPSVRRLSNMPGVTVTGTVDDIRPFLAQSRVAVVPIRISQGIQNKILEAVAAGLPVVTTSACAAGLLGISDLPIIVADQAPHMADKVIALLREPFPTEKIESSRRHLKRHYDWENNLSAFDGIFSELFSRSNASNKASKS